MSFMKEKELIVKLTEICPGCPMIWEIETTDTTGFHNHYTVQYRFGNFSVQNDLRECIFRKIIGDLGVMSVKDMQKYTSHLFDWRLLL